MDGKQFYTHCGGVFYDYRFAATRFNNEYFDNEEWMIKEYWFVSARTVSFMPIESDSRWTKLRKSLINYERMYYDGHEVKSVTLLGFTFSKGYSYDSRPIDKWEPLEIDQRY